MYKERIISIVENETHVSTFMYKVFKCDDIFKDNGSIDEQAMENENFRLFNEFILELYMRDSYFKIFKVNGNDVNKLPPLCEPFEGLVIKILFIDKK